MELRVNDYVRTKSGLIGKLMGSNAYDENKIAILIDDTKDIKITPVIDKEQIIKSSPNITDLIEGGDYVNGVLVESIFQREKDKLYIHSFDTEIMMCFTNNNIKSIVTHEQFESMEYKVGE